MRLIGINGFKGSGKDTVYKCIRTIQESAADRDLRGNLLSPHLRVERRAFGDNMKVFAAKLLGYEGTDSDLIELMNDLKRNARVGAFFNDGVHTATISGRTYLQNMTAAREIFGEDFWVDQIVPPVDGFRFHNVWSTRGRHQENPEVVGLPAIGCVTDVRFRNEAEAVLNVGGEVWRVVRPETESDGHDSEIELPPELVTLTIENSGDTYDLLNTVGRVL